MAVDRRPRLVIAMVLVLVLALALALVAVAAWRGLQSPSTRSGGRLTVVLVLPDGNVPEYEETTQWQEIGASDPVSVVMTAPAVALPPKPKPRLVAAPAVVAVVGNSDPHAGMTRKVIVSKGRRTVKYVPESEPMLPPAAADATPVPRAVRFDMNQNGKRMTADEFDAWMKVQGIRVANGAAKPTLSPSLQQPSLPPQLTPQQTPQLTPPSPPPAEPACKPDKDISC